MLWNDINFEKSYDKGKAYCQSKLANVLHGTELARRLANTGIAVYTLHPGKNTCVPLKAMCLFAFSYFLWKFL
jgi:NAD(P)-dependent dehydrogenase (short-subunit alcohol dehydrogenase family)